MHSKVIVARLKLPRAVHFRREARTAHYTFNVTRVCETSASLSRNSRTLARLHDAAELMKKTDKDIREDRVNEGKYVGGAEWRIRGA